MRENSNAVLARVEQKLTDFIEVTNKELQAINNSMKNVSESCNHSHIEMTQRIVDLETKQCEYKAVREDNEKRSKKNTKSIYYVVIPILSSVIGVLIYLLEGLK